MEQRTYKKPPKSYLRDPETFNDSGPLPSLFVFDLDYTLWPFWIDTHVEPPVRPTYQSELGSDGGESDGEEGGKDWYERPNGQHMGWEWDAKAGAGKAGGRRRRKDKKEDKMRADKVSRPSCAPTVTDRRGARWSFYPDVGAIFSAMKRRGIPIAIASRTSEDILATKMLNLLSLYTPILDDDDDGDGHGKEDHETATSSHPSSSESTRAAHPPPQAYRYTTKPAISLIAQSEIYPTTKKRHMARLREGLGIEYEDMLFLDDEPRNFDVERDLGVTMFLLTNDAGVTVDRVDQAVRKWRERKAQAETGRKRAK